MDLLKQPANNIKGKSEYTAEAIEVLEGLEPVRKRPGMYIGGVDSAAMHHLVSEVIDNSMDEAVAGYADTITVSLVDAYTISISDNGRGIPVDPHPKFPDKSALEIILTTLHAGGKFSDKAYNTAGGLHGVGVSVVNALSSELSVDVIRQGTLYSQTYSRGRATSDISSTNIAKRKRSGTKITFTPDTEIFGKIEFDPLLILNAIKSKAYLFKGVTIEWDCPEELASDEIPARAIIHFPNGLVDYLSSPTNASQQITQHIFSGDVKTGEKGTKVEWAISWSEHNSFIKSYCNTIPTPMGGTHEQGMRAALLKGIKAFSEVTNLKKAQNIIIDDILSCSQILFSVFINDPLFQGQTKEKLVSNTVAKIVETTMRDHLDHWLSKHRAEGIKLIECLIDKAEIRLSRKLEKSVKRKDALQKLKLPGKLADCTSKTSLGTELFIVEGDSAGGSAKQARIRETQAVLPLRGKILNVANATAEKISQNQEISALETALNCGSDNKCDISKLRYEKIVIMTDADVDGAHIAALLMTFFYIKMPDLIQNGHLYIARPPLYRISCKNKTLYAHSEQERDQVAETMSKQYKTNKIEVGRFKGLGEMTANQLKETTMNPETRVLTQVSITDIAHTQNLVDDLMGKNPEKRFNFITNHALSDMENIRDNLDL